MKLKRYFGKIQNKINEAKSLIILNPHNEIF